MGFTERCHVALWSAYTHFMKVPISWDTWLAQSVSPETLDLRAVNSSPTLGREIT